MADQEEANVDTYIKELSHKEFDSKEFIEKNLQTLDSNRSLLQFKDSLQVLENNAEETLKSFIFQNYELLISASNKITMVENYMSNLGNYLDEHKKQIETLKKISSYEDKHLSTYNNNTLSAEDDSESTKTIKILQNINNKTYDSEVVKILTCSYEIVNLKKENKILDDNFNILNKIHMKISEHEFENVINLITSFEFQQISTAVFTITEQNYINKKIDKIQNTMKNIALKLLSPAVSYLPISQNTRKMILTCLVNLNCTLYACELFLDYCKYHLLELLKNYNIGNDTAGYCNRLIDVYFAHLSPIIKEYKSFFPQAEYDSYLIVWLFNVISYFIEQFMHVLKIRSQPFHLIAKCFKQIEEECQKTLQSQGYHFLYFIYQSIYKHIEIFTETLLFNVKKKLKDNLMNETWEIGVDYEQMKEFDAFESFNLQQYINKQDEKKLNLSLTVLNYAKFLILFSYDSSLLNKSAELNHVILITHVGMLKTGYLFFKQLHNIKNQNDIFTNSMKFLHTNVIPALYVIYSELQFLDDIKQLEVLFEELY